MIPLTIDITPLAINRTAMYFIVRDTVRHLVLSGRPVQLMACGEPVDLPEFIANDFMLSESFEAKVGQMLGNALQNPQAYRAGVGRRYVNSRQARINLVFDPLYLLFMPPSARTIAYVLDLTTISRPAWHDENVSRLYKVAFDRLYDPSIDILSISESTSRDLWANYGIPRSRVRLIPLYDRFGHPVERGRRAASKRILFVGSLESRKNIVGLAKGFSLSGLAEDGYTLHIVGGDGHGADAIKAAVSGIEGVVLEGRLSDANLEQVYAQCCCLAYPSLWEGFGLPALEALSRGIPLLLADTGALPEVGGPFATYVDPCNPRAIAHGLRTLAMDTKDGFVVDDVGPRKRWLERYSRDAYLAVVDEVIGWVEGLMPREASFSESVEHSQAGMPEDRRAAKVSWYRQIQRRILLRSRVVPATLRDVPGNSFSLDYLYCLQQERRLRLSRTLAGLLSLRFLMFPWYLLKAGVETVSLQMTNAMIRSMINEITIQRLAARLERRDE